MVFLFWFWAVSNTCRRHFTLFLKMYIIAPTASCGSTSMATLAYLAQRVKRVDTLKKTLFRVLIEGDGGVFLARTGAFLRGRSLRSKENKSIFSKILGAFPVESFGADNDRGARIWTKRLFKDAIDALVKEYDLEMPRLPGFKYETWLEEQSELLQSLAKKQNVTAAIPRVAAAAVWAAWTPIQRSLTTSRTVL